MQYSASHHFFQSGTPTISNGSLLFKTVSALSDWAGDCLSTLHNLVGFESAHFGSWSTLSIDMNICNVLPTSHNITTRCSTVKGTVDRSVLNIRKDHC